MKGKEYLKHQTIKRNTIMGPIAEAKELEKRKIKGSGSQKNKPANKQTNKKKKPRIDATKEKNSGIPLLIFHNKNITR